MTSGEDEGRPDFEERHGYRCPHPKANLEYGALLPLVNEVKRNSDTQDIRKTLGGGKKLFLSKLRHPADLVILQGKACLIVPVD